MSAPAFLGQLRRVRNRTGSTYPSRLPLSGEQLQTFLVAEFDMNFDGPLVEVLVLCDSDLASTTNTCFKN